MPATARSVPARYRGERDERAGVQAARSRYGAREYRQLTPATISSGPGTRHRIESCRSCSGTADRSRVDPDLSCDECFELLDADVELELARGAADARCRSCAPTCGLVGLS
jgi:hypothetical protein